MTKKILIVDDSKLARIVAGKAIASLRPDWERLEAGGAEQALELLKSHQVDATVLDYNMAGKNGLELGQEIRERYPTLPIAIITANVQDEIIDAARAMGAAFISKPVTPDGLKEFSAVSGKAAKPVADPARELSDLERDAITELANIGVSRAAASLRKMVGRQVILSVPSVDILSRRAAATLIGEREQEGLVAVEQSFSGAFDGRALLIFPQANSLHLVRAIIGEADEPSIDPSEIEQEALAETGNVILNSCLGTIANMLRNSLSLSLPSVRRGSGADLFDSNEPEAAEGLVLFLYINFSVRDRDIRGYIAMLMDLPALAAMRSLIGDFVKRYLPPEEVVAFDSQASLQELRQLAGPLFASIEHSVVPVAVTDPRLPDTPFIFVNPAFTRLMGYTLADLGGKKLAHAARFRN